LREQFGRAERLVATIVASKQRFMADDLGMDDTDHRLEG
jgi:hypothetical protein